MASPVHTTRRMRSLLASSMLVLLAACSSSSGSTDSSPASDDATDDSTSITIGIDSEDLTSEGLPEATLQVITRIDGATKTVSVDAHPNVPSPFPYELKVSPPKNKPDAELDIQVNVIGSDTSALGDTPPLVTRLAKTHFVPGAQKLAYVYLETRCNHAAFAGGSLTNGPTCDETANTCIGGTCTSADLPPLPDYYDWKKSPPSDCGTGTGELTIGQGLDSLMTLADGDTVTLEQGPQCGHHFFVALSMKNLAQSGTITTISASQPGTAVTAPATAYPYRWVDAAAGTCELDGLRLQVDAGSNTVADFLGKPLDVRVDLADKAGHTATAVRHIMVAPTFDNPSGRDCTAMGTR